MEIKKIISPRKTTTTTTTMTDWLKCYDGAIPADLCDKICATLDEAIENKNVSKIETTYRRCYQETIPNPEKNIDLAKLWEILKIAILANFEKYKEETKESSAGCLNHCTRMEKGSLIRYDVGDKNFFHLHADNWNSASAARQVSVILYLNDVKEGGETIFPRLKTSFAPTKGSIVFFPSFFTHTHSATEPISNSKYIYVTWFCFDGSEPFYLRL